jgi:glycosyltransferase involved in cell wall biosynthesis
VLLHQLRRARVAVFPSFAEVCAMAPLEAMACGCPTISSARGSGPELFDHERHGLLVDPGNPAAIAAAIVRLLRDDDLASRLAAAGREHVVERFGLAGRLNDNLDFYSDCLHRFAGGRRASPRPVAIGA